MDTFRTYSTRWLVILGWLMLLLTACSALDAPVVVGPVTAIPLGTTFWTGQTTAGLFTVAWSPDGTRLASVSWDKTVQLWDAVTGNHLLTYRGHTDLVLAVAWSPNGERIASAADDIRVWQAV